MTKLTPDQYETYESLILTEQMSTHEVIKLIDDDADFAAWYGERMVARRGISVAAGKRARPLVAFESADFELIKAMPKDAAAILRAANSTSSYLDLSFELGVPMGTVKSRLHRARQRLAKLRSADSQKETTP